jgi:hypothetical protein
VEAQNGAVEGLVQPGIADLHHSDEDSDPHQSEKADPDQQHSVLDPRH